MQAENGSWCVLCYHIPRTISALINSQLTITQATLYHVVMQYNIE
jgi:hypothetical protein